MTSTNSDQAIRILCAANASFAAPLCVMLTSLVIHHAGNRGIEITVFTTGMPEADRRKIESSLRGNRPDLVSLSLQWVDVNGAAFQDANLSGHASLETYLRLLAPALLPPDWDRILYLDGDMVILSDLSALYDMSFAGMAVVATQDIDVGIASARDGVFNYAELGIPGESPYYNGGVMLINLDLWRRDHLADRIICYLNQHKKSVFYWDQGGMNAILYNNWRKISPLWNQTRAVNHPELWTRLGYSIKEWNEVRNHAKIIHYAAPYKPWRPRPGMRRPGDIHYFHYLEKTPYWTSGKGPILERIFGFRLYFLIWHFMRKIYLFFKRIVIPTSSTHAISL